MPQPASPPARLAALRCAASTVAIRLAFLAIQPHPCARQPPPPLLPKASNPTFNHGRRELRRSLRSLRKFWRWGTVVKVWRTAAGIPQALVIFKPLAVKKAWRLVRHQLESKIPLKNCLCEDYKIATGSQQEI
uniref:Uncharacterized protein n=1 Tax=Coccidioides posadasii RMSCC 3488 TaxID=454284 RepID=A0A0J6FDT9_COCPO|nr:hypothetical protein CPAG_04800 [Coccidioides posadasii RMSCC 3488]